MTLDEIVNRIWERLGREYSYYPVQEVVRSGVNPAQHLICLMQPGLMNQRTTVSILANQVLVDLRVETPRLWHLRRVMMGDVTTDPPTASNGQMWEILPISEEQRGRRKDWFKRQGKVTRYWRHGRNYLGLFRRSVQADTLTLVHRSLPTYLTETPADLGLGPDINDAYHPMIADVAAALLLMKEGAIEIQKAFQMMGTTMNEETFGQMSKAVERTVRFTARMAEHGG